MGPGSPGGLRRTAARLRAWLGEAYVRAGVQMATATFLIMATTSPEQPWLALSVDPVVFTPAMALLLCYLNLLFSIGSGQAALQVASELLVGSCMGAGVGMGIMYAAYGINGASRDDTVTKAAVTLSLSVAIVFVNTVLRFRFAPAHNQVWMFSIVGIALTLAPAYHPFPQSVRGGPARVPPIWEVGVHWVYYAVIASVTMLLTMTCVLPRTAGSAIRAALASGLEGLGATVVRGFEVMTGDVDPLTGLLCACSGAVDPERVGLDSGLWKAGLRQLYGSAQTCSNSINTVWKYEGAARLELELYRKQRVLPSRSFNVLTLTLRSMLSSFMMVIYPLQTGGLDCRTEHAAGAELRALALTMEESLRVLARVLRGETHFADALPLLERVETRYLQADVALKKGEQGTILPGKSSDGAGDLQELLAEEVLEELEDEEVTMMEKDNDEVQPRKHTGGGAVTKEEEEASTETTPQVLPEVPAKKNNNKAPSALHNQVLSSRMLASTLHTLCMRLCQLHLCLTEGLGRDDPGAPLDLAAYLASGRVKAPKLWGLREAGGVEEATMHAHTSQGFNGHTEDGAPALASRSTSGSSLLRREHSAALRASLAVLRDSLSMGNTAGLARPETASGEQKANTRHRQENMLRSYLAAHEPELKVVPARAIRLNVFQRALDKLEAGTGIHRNHLRVGAQGAVGYFIIMLMVIIPETNDAFDHRMLWGLIIVITILEPMTGQVMIKGIQRLLGTVLGAGLGVGLMYFTYLCNGLTYTATHIEKYIVMTISLSIVIGILGGCAARWPTWLYNYMIAAVITAIVALPNYHEDEVLPKTALWRLAATSVAVGVDILLAACLFPVTGRDVFKALMAKTLGGVGWLMHAAAGSLVPRKHRHRGRSGFYPSGDSAAMAVLGEGRASDPNHSRRSLQAAGGAPRGDTLAPEQEDLHRMSVALFRNASMLVEAQRSDDDTGSNLGRRSDGSLVAEKQPGAIELARTLSTEISTISPNRGAYTILPHATSIYVEVPDSGPFKLVGKTYMAIQPELKAQGLRIMAMRALEQPLRYEYYPLSKVKRFPFDAAQRALFLCRQMVNIAGSFSAALDAHDTYSCPLLIPVSKELSCVQAQMEACLAGLAGFVKEEIEIETVVDMVLNLEKLMHHFFMSMAASEIAIDAGDTVDALLAITFLALLFNASYTIRLLAVALVRTFAPQDVDGLAMASLMADSGHWAIDEQIALLCSELMAGPVEDEEMGDGVRPMQHSIEEQQQNGTTTLAPQAPALTSRWENDLAEATRALV